jgi:hypothetical protein
MKIQEEFYAVIAIEAWYNDHKENFQKYCTSVNLKNSGRGSAEIQLETSKYVISISVWNHASTIEIQKIEVKTENTALPTLEACITRGVFEKDLNLFWCGSTTNIKTNEPSEIKSSEISFFVPYVTP